MAAVASGLACGRREPVRAPMIAVPAASASALGPSGPPVALAADPGDVPFHAGARYTGTYTCPQGPTSLTFVFDEVRPLRGGEGVALDVTFAFELEGGQGQASAEGSAHMSGTFDPKTRRFRLHAEGWIEEPPGYRLVDFSGLVDRRGLLSGRVEGPGCSTFHAAPDRSDDDEP